MDATSHGRRSPLNHLWLSDRIVDGHLPYISFVCSINATTLAAIRAIFDRKKLVQRAQVSLDLERLSEAPRCAYFNQEVYWPPIMSGSRAGQ